MKRTVIFNALAGSGHYNGLLCIYKEMACRHAEGRGSVEYACKFVVNAQDIESLLNHFRSMGATREDVNSFEESIVSIEEETSIQAMTEVIRNTGVMPIGEANDARFAAVDRAVETILESAAAENQSAFGVIDIFSSAAARALLKRKVPFYVTLPGPPTFAALCGVRGVGLRPGEYLPYLAFRMVPSIVKLMKQFKATVKESCDPARAIFSSGIEIDSCFGRSGDKVLHFVRTFSDRRQHTPIDSFPDSIRRFFDTSSSPPSAEYDPLPIVVCSSSTLEFQSLTAVGLATLYRALRRGRDRWRVVWRVGHRESYEEAMANVGDRSRDDEWFTACDTWIPQVALLSHPQVKCFVSHMGWNGTNEALMSGTPILATPVGADQPENAALCKKLGVAIVLDTVDPNSSFTTPPRDVPFRPPERFDVDSAYQSLRAILEPDSSYQQAALRVQQKYFQGDGLDDEAHGIGPGAVVAAIEADEDAIQQ